MTSPAAQANHPDLPTVIAESAMPERFQPVALALAFAFPGLGHWFLGLRRRAVLVAIGVLGLIVSGIGVAGIDAIDGSGMYTPSETINGKPVFTPVDREVVQIIGSLFAGPVVIAIDQIHQRRFKVLSEEYSDNRPIMVRRNALPNEIRDPRSGAPIVVRDRKTGAPLEFQDPVTGTRRLSTSADRPPNIPALSRVREIGGLFVCLAGMMNLIAMIDAAYARRRTIDPDAPPIRRALRALQASQSGGAR